MKRKYTKKPFKAEGWYWIKDKKGGLEIALALDVDRQELSLCTESTIGTWDELLQRGFKRSVKQIEESAT